MKKLIKLVAFVFGLIAFVIVFGSSSASAQTTKDCCGELASCQKQLDQKCPGGAPSAPPPAPKAPPKPVVPICRTEGDGHIIRTPAGAAVRGCTCSDPDFVPVRSAFPGDSVYHVVCVLAKKSPATVDMKTLIMTLTNDPDFQKWLQEQIDKKMSTPPPQPQGVMPLPSQGSDAQVYSILENLCPPIEGGMRRSSAPGDAANVEDLKARCAAAAKAMRREFTALEPHVGLSLMGLATGNTYLPFKAGATFNQSFGFASPHGVYVGADFGAVKATSLGGDAVIAGGSIGYRYTSGDMRIRLGFYGQGITMTRNGAGYRGKETSSLGQNFGPEFGLGYRVAGPLVLGGQFRWFVFGNNNAFLDNVPAGQPSYTKASAGDLPRLAGFEFMFKMSLELGL